MTEQTKIRLQLETSAKGFSVLIITAGNGNGWEFPADVLEDSVSLWDGVKSFIDHSWYSRSVRDLCAVLKNPTWDAEAEGIRADFIPFGPAKEIVSALAKDIIENPDLAKGIGLSAALSFTATGSTVKQILEAESVDVVIDPARGGEFTNALQIAKLAKDNRMTQNTQDPQAGDVTPADENVAESVQNAQAIVDAQLSAQTQAEAKEKQEKIIKGMLSNLLTSSLTAANLPEVSAKAVRAQFDGRLFEPEELTAAIEAKKEEVAQLTAGQNIMGPGRVQMGATSGEQFEAAVYDLMNAPRPDSLKEVKADRLSGIREMYHMATGDIGFYGGADPEKIRVQFATASDLPNLLADITNKLVRVQVDVLNKAGYGWWRKIANIERVNSMQDMKGIMVGQVDVLPTVAEGEPYTQLDVEDNKETAAFVKKGAYLGLTLEMFQKDDTRKLAAYPKILANASVRTLSSLIAAIFTANSGTGPAMADTHNLFDATNHGNLLTTALGTTSTAWDAVATAVYKQAMLAPSGDNGGILGIDPKYLLVPRELKSAALNILVPRDTTQAAIGEKDDVIVVPEWTDATDWAAIVDPALAPAITVGHVFGIEPEIFVAGNPTDYAVFTNDQSRIKVRQITAVLVEDYRPIHKSNVA